MKKKKQTDRENKPTIKTDHESKPMRLIEPNYQIQKNKDFRKAKLEMHVQQHEFAKETYLPITVVPKTFNKLITLFPLTKPTTKHHDVNKSEVKCDREN